MNFLPIAGRELRVAARKRSTFWLRVTAAATGIVLGSGCFLLSRLQGASLSQIGTILFQALTWTCLVVGLSAGLFFTSDCLSEEKREGTLGLLFLTELRGYDVALGKLLATSLRGFYALLAVLPIVAITQLMGGITGEQYWKCSLALVNGLVLSLAAGMLVSAINRDSQKALGATLLVLLLLVFGGPIADLIISDAKQRAFQPVWSVSSPGYVFIAASAWGRSAYWDALAITQLITWAMFALACLLVRHTWQDKKRAGARTSRSWAYVWKHGSARRRQRLRRRLLERQPMAWLACRDRWQALALSAGVALVAGSLVIILLNHPLRAVWSFWSVIGGFLTLLLYLWVTSQACRFLFETRRSGFLELLLVTPVNEKQIVAGQWRALLGAFGLPVLLLLGANLGSTVLSQLETQRVISQAIPSSSLMATNQGTVVTSHVTVAGVTVSGNAGTTSNPTWPGFQIGATAQVMAIGATALLGALATVGNFLALCWFGMWMGMTSRTANLATLKTILFVQIIPWVVIGFGAAMAMIALSLLASRSSSPGAWSVIGLPLVMGLVFAGLSLLKDLGFILWSRRKLLLSLRHQAAHGFAQPRLAIPTPAPKPPFQAPPIIAG